MDEFRKLSEPLVKWLKENCHPHTTIIIDCNHAEVLEGLKAEVFND